MNGDKAAICGIALLIAVAADHMVFSHEQQNFGWGALIRAVPEFFVGAFAYRFYREGILLWFWEKDATLISLSIMVVATCLADVSDGAIVVLLLALLLASVCNSGKLRHILSARPLRWLGQTSYSIYIFQILPFMVTVNLSGMFIAAGLGGFRFQVIASLFAIGVGILVHRCIDAPARAALRRLPDQVMIFAGDRAAKMRFTCLTTAGMPEQDR